MKLQKCNGISLTVQQVFENLQKRYPMVPLSDNTGKNQRVLLMAAYIEYHQPSADTPVQAWVTRDLGYFRNSQELPFYGVRMAAEYEETGEIKDVTLPASHV